MIPYRILQHTEINVRGHELLRFLTFCLHYSSTVFVAVYLTSQANQIVHYIYHEVDRPLDGSA